MKTLFLNNYFDYVLVFLLVIFSGNPALTNLQHFDFITLLFALYLLIYSFFRNSHIIKPLFTKVCLIFSIIIIIQFIDLSFFPLRTISGFFIRLFIAFTILLSINNFPKIFIRTMAGLSTLAIILHYLRLKAGLDLPAIFEPLAEIFGVTVARRQCAFVHTFFFDNLDKYRNAGMFWEPGAFAGYLILSFIMLRIIKKEVDKKEYILYFIIFTIALFSTQSTMGYLCFPLAVIINISKDQVKQIISGRLLLFFIIIPLLSIVSFYSYTNISFLKQKIDSQGYVVDRKTGAWYATRIGNLIFDLKYIKERPLFGWGPHPKTRFYLNQEMIGKELGMGNGMSDFIVKYGTVGFLTFLYLIFINFEFHFRNPVTSSLCVLLVLLTLQGEMFLNYPLYLGLMFLNQGLETSKVKRRIVW